MPNTKSWLASKAVWGGLIAIVATVATWFGYGMSAGDQAGIVDGLVIVGGAVGGLLAIVGRVYATKQIG